MTHGTFTAKDGNNSFTGDLRTPPWENNLLLVQLDGSSLLNTLKYAEWDFTPDDSPLPTKPGWYMMAENTPVKLAINGQWYAPSGIPLGTSLKALKKQNNEGKLKYVDYDKL